MDLRLACYELSARHKLPPVTARQLHDLSGADSEPEQLERSFTAGLTMTAAFLGGAGVIFWIAANWDAIGRFGRFALLQGLFLALTIGAASVPRARAALATAAFMTMGGLFAYFGQTYQTGADPWQLFAAWSLLSLPICLAAKSDAVWTAWCWVTMTGISLWIAALVGYRWHIGDADRGTYLQAWGMAAAACALLSPLAARFTESGLYLLRRKNLPVFMEQFILAALVLVGLVHLGCGIRDDFSNVQTWLFMAPVAMAVAWLMARRWLQCTFAALSCFFLLQGLQRSEWAGSLIALYITPALIALIAWIALHATLRYAQPPDPALMPSQPAGVPPWWHALHLAKVMPASSLQHSAALTRWAWAWRPHTSPKRRCC